MLRALRESAGVTQDVWAGLLGYGRKTIQRWESGETVPDASAEAAILALCRERELPRRLAPGQASAAEALAALQAELAGARLEKHNAATEGSAPHAGWSPVGRGQQGAQLALPLTSFVGRAEEITQLSRLLATQRLVTLLGAGGVGKTRLAAETARQLGDALRDGVAWVELASLGDAGFVAAAIAQALGVRELAGESLEATLIAHLRECELLLVLDNFEHLLDAAQLVGRLLARCPNVRALVTSRAPLRLRGEHLYRLQPLAAPDERATLSPALAQSFPALQLFLDRARAVRPAFVLSEENCAHVAEICRRLDGLPLAIELSTARLTTLTTASLLDRLERPLQLLTGGSRDLPARHQTLDATIGWSYDLLQPGEQRLLARLAVFRGGCALAAVEAICGEDGAPEATLDALQALVENSLLHSEEDAEGAPRFRMFETVREFAVERLRAAGEETAMRRAHLRWFRWLPERAQAEIEDHDQIAWLHKVEPETDNIRAALAWSLEDDESAYDGLVLVGTLSTLWSQGHLEEGCLWLRRILDSGAGTGTTARAHALYYQAQHELYRGEVIAAARACEECISLARTLGQDSVLANGLAMLADIRRYSGGGRALAEEAVEAARRSGEPTVLMRAFYGLGAAAQWEGDLNRAVEASWEAVRWGQGTFLHSMTSAPLREIAVVALRRGDLAEARRLLEESIALRAQHQDDPNMVNGLALLGRVAAAEGEHAEAGRCYQEAIERARGRIGAAYVPLVLSGRAVLAMAQGDLSTAVRLFGAAEILGETANWACGEYYRGEHMAAIADLRAQLGEEEFARLWAEGRRANSVKLLGGPASEFDDD